MYHDILGGGTEMAGFFLIIFFLLLKYFKVSESFLFWPEFFILMLYKSSGNESETKS